MPRYDASKDDKLKSSFQFTIEKQFFLGQYKKRKFITDKNVLFDKNDSDDTKNEVADIFECNEMDYKDVIRIYNNFVGEVTEGIFPHVFIDTSFE